MKYSSCSILNNIMYRCDDGITVLVGSCILHAACGWLHALSFCASHLVCSSSFLHPARVTHFLISSTYFLLHPICSFSDFDSANGIRFSVQHSVFRRYCSVFAKHFEVYLCCEQDGCEQPKLLHNGYLLPTPGPVTSL